MIPYAEKEDIIKALPYPLLMDRIKTAFAKNTAITPQRHHHDFENPSEDKKSTLLLMPSWVPGENLGVKVVTVSPNNARYQLPSIHGVYLFFDALTGVCKLLLDAKVLTVLRTAATSAMASSFLSRKDSSVMLMAGTGALAPELIRAHAAVRPINKVLVWGRDSAKAKKLINDLQQEKMNFEVVTDLKEGIKKADIISCATLSDTPLVQGQHLHEGQHLDLVGAYRPHMREADDEAIRRSMIFVDHYPGALNETGEIMIPVKSGVLLPESIKADLHELCAGSKPGRTEEMQITLFKSVGHALEDLTAAEMVFDYFKKEKKV